MRIASTFFKAVTSICGRGNDEQRFRKKELFSNSAAGAGRVVTADADTFYGFPLGRADQVFEGELLQGLHRAIAFLRPKASPVPLRRIGGDNDGAYLVPDDLEGVAACFSPGVNNFKDFEDELCRAHGMRAHMCDASSNPALFRTPLIRGQQTFTRKWLAPKDAEHIVAMLRERVAHRVEGLARGLARRQETLAGEVGSSCRELEYERIPAGGQLIML